MSLERPLAQSLVNSLAKPLAGYASGYYAALAALVEKWPLKSSLIGSEGTPITLTRASTAIYQNVYGDFDIATDFATVLNSYGLANKCENFNGSPDALLTGMTDDASVTTTRLELADEIAETFTGTNTIYEAGVINGYVFRTENLSGGDAGVTISGQTGNTNKHSGVVLCQTLSTGVTVDLYLGATLVYSTTSPDDGSPFFLLFADVTPTATDELKIVVPDTVIIQHLLHMLVESDKLPVYFVLKEGVTTVDRIWMDGDQYTALSLNYNNDTIPAYGAGLSIEGASTNKCTNYNFAPDAALTNVLDSGGVTTTRVLISDVPEPYKSQIQAKIQNLTNIGVNNGYIFKSEASGAFGTARINYSGGNLNTHVASIFAVTDGLGGGETFRINNQTSESVPLPLEFSRVEINAFTPTAATNRQPVVRLDDGTTAYWLGVSYEESQVVTSPIITEGATGTRALTDVSVSTTGFPVNDGSYLIYLPQGLKDVGANQYMWNSTIDSNNWNRLLYVTGSNDISWSARNAGEKASCTVSYTPDSTPLWIMVSADGTTGKKLTLSNGNSDTDVSTADLKFDSTMQIGAFNSSTAFMSGQVAYLTRFNEVITDINAAIQASEYGK